jgi:hypothetical protein
MERTERLDDSAVPLPVLFMGEQRRKGAEELEKHGKQKISSAPLQ